jgi:hypothetical protein
MKMATTNDPLMRLKRCPDSHFGSCPLPDLRRGERGQTTIFFVAAFWTLFLFLAFVVNLGQAINRRVLLQMVADAGAWTGAAKQAQVLNSLSDLNDYEKNFIYTPAQILSVNWTVTIEPAGEIANTLWSIGNMIYKIAFKLRNQLGNMEAVSAAIAVTQKNNDSLFPNDSLDYPKPAAAYALTELIKTKAVEKMAGSSTEFVGLYWIGANTYNPDLSEVWYIADSNHKKVNFLWWVKAPETGGPVLPTIFRIPAMTAVALAKPTNGSLDPEDSGNAHSNGYKARMIPLSYLKDSEYRDYMANWITMGLMGGDMVSLLAGVNTPISTPLATKILH